MYVNKILIKVFIVSKRFIIIASDYYEMKPMNKFLTEPSSGYRSVPILIDKQNKQSMLILVLQTANRIQTSVGSIHYFFLIRQIQNLFFK